MQTPRPHAPGWFMIVLSVASVYVALTGSAWWFALTGLLVVLTAFTYAHPLLARRAPAVRREVLVLQDGDSEPAHPAAPV